jgi:EF-hand domain pair
MSLRPTRQIQMLSLGFSSENDRDEVAAELPDVMGKMLKEAVGSVDMGSLLGGQQGNPQLAAMMQGNPQLAAMLGGQGAGAAQASTPPPEAKEPIRDATNPLEEVLTDPENQQMLYEMFNKYDTDHNGSLSADEVFGLTKDFLELLDTDQPPPTFGLAQKIVETLDTDGDGTVSFKELCENAPALKRLYKESQ